ncbi:DUF1837 domain-containing protein [Pseudomonas sp. CG7]|uniref:HamA C-terminal domain-containing protein n=1 Tax=Pseudomonas sp. CG7 TaxID=191007 RepID=UPI00255101B4|nr:Hachiman antiphage defense system protein HamA [Pseudomonas sp. CG7]MCM2460290.1 DUF1837 domain-containing protein [Pseudomonas sp. CG7]
MVLIPRPSNKGGPAARQGFKYQDHVAVTFILKMLRDSRYIQVECETADDIVVVSEASRQIVNEYIQVKTTEGDSKWNLKEATTLDSGKPDTSLFQKSLLCDLRPGLARFRMVSRRDIATVLGCFRHELEKRTLPDDGSVRGDALVAKFKKTLSPQGRNFRYWADNFVWQVCGTTEALESLNLRKLAEIIEIHGGRPTHKQQQEIYEDFLGWADDAATANVITAPADKIIPRQAAMDRFKALLAAAEKAGNAFSKPYKSKPDPFLVEFHAATESGLLRSIAGYDVEYDFEEWRCKDLAEHLIQWLPEFCLRASEIVNFQVHHAKTMLAKAVNTFTQTNMQRDQLIAELILHVILRNRKNSEPIACKVFYAANGKLSEFGNAHIVQHPGETDQLWLGLSRMIPAGSMSQTITEICAVLDATISKTALSNERDIIINLREPHHHLPNAEEFNKALQRNSPAQELLKVLCFPILLAYDSDALASGFLSDYIATLKTEVTNHYSSLKALLPRNVEQVKVAVFLVPIESIQKLVDEFNSLCEVAS